MRLASVPILVLDCFAESCSFFLSPSEVHEAVFQRADFAEPFVLACFGESLLGVVGHVLQAPGLCWVHLQEAAFDGKWERAAPPAPDRGPVRYPPCEPTAPLSAAFTTVL